MNRIQEDFMDHIHVGRILRPSEFNKRSLSAVNQSQIHV